MNRNVSYFLSKTKPVGECLEWQGCLNTDGYPRISWKGSSNGKLHRIIWELTNGYTPVGKVIRHTCDNPKCINPEHLVAGTSIENVDDRVSRDRNHGLKQKDVLVIKQLFLNKTYSAKELAKMFEVSLRTIYYTVTER